jgi:Xaa-Pro aminopeptidase
MSLIREKVAQAAGLLEEFGVDCWITFTRESAINGDPVLPFLVTADLTWHSALIVGRDGRTRAIVGQYDKKMIEDTGAWDTVAGFVTGIREPLQEYLKEIDPGRIAVNYSESSEACDGLTHGMYLTLHRLLSEIGMAGRLESAERIISALRERKSATEIGHIREAIRTTEDIFRMVAGYIRPGRTEKEIAAFMTAEVARRGLVAGWDAATCPAVFTGPDTAGAHYVPTDRKVEPGHVLNMDFGVKVKAYCSDMQRTFYVLESGEREAPADVARGFAAIVDAIETSRRAMKPGVPGIEIDAVARRVLAAAGYDEFPHALGHQVGRFSHDGTALLAPNWEKYARRPFQPLEEGMVFTIEPRLTVPGRGVVTIEEMVVVTKEGAVWLSTPQKTIWLVDAKEAL